jgi:hypothetical protein
MTEGAIKPDIEDHPNSESENATGELTVSDEQTGQADTATAHPQIIWTPRFIVICALALVSGLSIASLLTQGWLNGIYTGQSVFQVYLILIIIGWLALLLFAHSNWIRTGSIFGCIWALFMTLNIILSTQHSDLASRVQALVNAATCIALLGSYICLSIDNTPFSSVDAWFFGLAPVVGSIAVALIYVLVPLDERSLNIVENAIASVALVLSLLVWWIRSSSWKTKPGPTFLFSCVPLIFLLLAISGTGFDPSNYFLANVLLRPIPNLSTNETNFVISQVALLCLLLGLMRVLQAECRSRKSVSHDTLNL